MKEKVLKSYSRQTLTNKKKKKKGRKERRSLYHHDYKTGLQFYAMNAVIETGTVYCEGKGEKNLLSESLGEELKEFEGRKGNKHLANVC